MINFYSYFNGSLIHNNLAKELDYIDYHGITKHLKLCPILINIIKKKPYWAYGYAQHIIRGRWPEAEPYILTNTYYAYWYAVRVIKGRWPELEPYIIKHRFAYHYARDCIKVRWIEAEPYIKRDKDLWYDYCKEFGL